MSIHHPCREASPEHNAAITILDSGDGVFKEEDLHFTLFWIKVQFLSWLIKALFSTFDVCPTWLLEICHLLCSFCNSFLLDSYIKITLYRAWLTVVQWTDSSTWAVDLYSSSRVTMGLLTASLITALLVMSVRKALSWQVYSCAIRISFTDDGLNILYLCEMFKAWNFFLLNLF